LADWIPEIGCNVYIKEVDRTLDLSTGDCYGVFTGIIDKRYHIARFDGKNVDIGELFFFKWFSKVPMIEVVKRVCKVKTDVDKTPKINRKR